MDDQRYPQSIGIENMLHKRMCRSKDPSNKKEPIETKEKNYKKMLLKCKPF